MKLLSLPGISVDQSGDFYRIKKLANTSNEGYYYLSNDVIDQRIQSTAYPTVFVGIANPHWFHALAVFAKASKQIQRCVAIDTNPAQLRHFSRLRKKILESKNRIDYVQQLFKVELGSDAKNILEGFGGLRLKTNYVHGGVARDWLYGVEKKVWSNSKFDAEAFEKEYDIKVLKQATGLKLKSQTVGGMDTYQATIMACARKDFDCWPFTAGWGFGYLKDEAAFDKMRKLLRSTELYMMKGDIADEGVKVISSLRYWQIGLWSSNVFDEYFVRKHPKLERLHNLLIQQRWQEDPDLPELDMIMITDRRIGRNRLRKMTHWRKKLSIHTKSFRGVARYVKGVNNIEVVNMKSWIQKDKGESKLYPMEYMLSDNFLVSKRKFDTVLLHILVGHGMEINEFEAMAMRAKKVAKRLLILEHNSESRDFKEKGVGMNLKEIREMLGRESCLEWLPGKRCKDRNILLVYDR